MNKLQPHINVDYPPNNRIIFEEWFAGNYKGCDTVRELLPFFPTSYWVNNNYGQDKLAYAQAVYYIDQLDKSKKYFVICQYDDGCLINFAELGLDVLEFNMSKQNGVMLPLLCQPHPYNFTSTKRYFANFVGSKTHPIRETANNLKQHSDYYISFEPHDIMNYCRIIHESMFTLCYRGYGANSFRIGEAIQYGSIPVYISDEFILPFNIDFNEFGVLIKSEDATRTDEILQSVPIEDIIKKQEKLKEVYEKYYTYKGCFREIIKVLENESASKA